MKNLKKVLSLVLALAMALSLMTVAFAKDAGDYVDYDEITNKEAVDVLTALNVIDGMGNNTFQPNGTLTRAQMAKMITIICLGNVDPSAFLGTTTDLKDINGHWGEAYVKYCYSQGIISGRGNGVFDPNANVTAVEAAKMLLTAIGYNSDVQGYEGNSWKINTIRDAQTSGFFEDLSVTADKVLTRDEAAQMIWNAVQANTINKQSSVDRVDGTITDIYTADGDPLLEKTFDAVTKVTYMTGITYNADKGEYTYSFNHEDTAHMGATVTADAYDDAALTTADDFSDLFGQKVTVVYKVDGAKRVVYGIYGEGEVLASDVISSITDTDGNALVATDKDTKIMIGDNEYRLEAAASLDNGDYVRAFNYNNDTANVSLAYAAANREDYYSFDAIDNDADGRIDCLVVYPVAIGQVAYVGKTNVSVDTKYGAASTYSLEDDTIYSGIAEDDYVLVTAGLDGNDVVTKLDSVVSGEVTKINKYSGNNAIELVVDGTTYKIDDTAEDTITSGNLGKNLKEAVAYNGYLFYTDASAAATGVDQFAVVLDAEVQASFGNKHPKVMLLLNTGETVTVDAADDYTAMVTNNSIVTYSVEKGVYTLTAANKGSVSGYDFDGVLTNATYSKKDGKIGNAYIADDAVIFVKNSDNDWTVISGADLKAKGNVSVPLAYTVKDSNTGYSSVVLAKINAQVATSTESYGYVTSGISNVKTDDGIVAQFTMWNGSESVTVTTKDLATTLATNGLAKGNIIIYDDLGDGVIEVRDADLALTEAAVLAYNAENIQFSGDTVALGKTGVGTPVDAEITDDTVILYFDSDEVTGIEGGRIRLATETADSTDAVPEYYTNVGYTVANGEVTILVVEVNNNYSNVAM